MTAPGTGAEAGSGAQDPAAAVLSRGGRGRPDDGDTAGRLAFAVGRLNRLLRPSGAALSPGVLLALSTVVRRGPLRPSELGRIEGVAAPTATRVIVDLEARGLVSRSADPDDGRSFFVEATAEGVEAVLTARRERAEHASVLLASLSDDHRAAVVSALGALEALADSGDL